MSEVDVWRCWSTRLQELATELRQLSEAETGSTLRERRYKEYLRLALHHTHVAEDAATAMSEDVGWGGLQPTPDGPSPSNRTAMTVRFASDILGWTPRKAAAQATITTAQYRLIRNGTGTPVPEAVEKLLAALSRQGIDMVQLARIVDNVLTRKGPQTEAAYGSLEHTETSGEATSIHEPPSPIVYHVPPAGEIDKRCPSKEPPRNPAGSTESAQTTADARRPLEILHRLSSNAEGDERPPPQWK